MFRFLVKFFKILVIACLIGVLLRSIEVILIKQKSKNVAISNTVNETQYKETIKIASNEENLMQNMEKDNQKKQEDGIVETKKETDTKQNIKKQNSTIEKKEKAEIEQKAEKQEISNNKTLPETTKQEILEKKQETQIENKYTEVKVDMAEKKECSNNTHGMEVGNSGKWFNTKDEAIATYKAEIKKWGNKWTNNEISDEDYYSNCPCGYEIWDCPFCNKWTINYYFDNM